MMGIKNNKKVAPISAPASAVFNKKENASNKACEAFLLFQHSTLQLPKSTNG